MHSLLLIIIITTVIVHIMVEAVPSQVRCEDDSFTNPCIIQPDILLNIEVRDSGGCVLPDVVLNLPQLLLRNSSLSVNISWTPLERENNMTICNYTFSVRVYQSSTPYDFEDNAVPPHDPNGRYEEVNQQTNFIFNNINRDIYYLFELRVQSLPRFNRYYSYVHYFGDQVPARVTDPVPGYTVIRVTKGDSVTVPCEGTGIPTPSVLLLREVTNVPHSCNGCPKNNFIPAISEQDAGEYFCVAVNTLVSRGCSLTADV